MKFMSIKAYDFESNSRGDEVTLDEKRDYLVNPDSICYIVDVTDQVINRSGVFCQLRLSNDVCLVVDALDLKDAQEI